MHDLENETTLFLVGIKPCVLHGVKRPDALSLKQKGYPYITVSEKVGGRRSLLFFQNEKDLKRFVTMHNIEDRAMSFDDKLLGKALGFPPFAYNAFPIEDPNDRYCIDYHGIIFVCKKQDVYQCLLYMHKRFPIPRQYQTCVEVASRANNTWTSIFEYIA